MAKAEAFHPDWESAPGDTIADILEERKLSPSEFAKRLGGDESEVQNLILGAKRISNEIAQRLEAVLGGSAQFWNNREAQYREALARKRGGEMQSSEIIWVRDLPVNDMARFGWIHPASSSRESKIAACLEFFDVPNPAAWNSRYLRMLDAAAFKTSRRFKSKPAAVAAWLRQGEVESRSIHCATWNPERFRDSLSTIRRLTWRKSPGAFVPELQKICAESGVAVVILRAPNGCKASGATRFVTPNNALLLLSMRYLSDDHFWFTFFHEAGHLLLHEKSALFLEGTGSMDTKEEREADEFAANVAVPRQFEGTMLKLPLDGRAVIQFARRIGIAPGIVVGQLQHRGLIKHGQLNSLKRRFVWR